MRVTRLRYGVTHAQHADLLRPAERDRELPVLVLIHGGYWKQIYTKRLMRPLAKAVVDLGWIAYNVEYRRVGWFGKGGWPATFDDVSAAIGALGGVAGIDLDRIVTCGHSAGGHLALWVASSRTSSNAPRTPDTAATPVTVRAAISLAGVVDLNEAARLRLGGGAVQALMGGEPTDHPDRYALGSPATLLPIGVRQVLIHGTDDLTVPASMSAAYVKSAVAQGDPATYVPLTRTTHLDLIRPRGVAFDAIVGALDEVTTSSGP